MRFRSVFSLKAVANYINDPAQNAPVLHAWHSVHQRKKRLNPFHLPLRQQEHIIHRLTLHRKSVNQNLSLNSTN